MMSKILYPLPWDHSKKTFKLKVSSSLGPLLSHLVRHPPYNDVQNVRGNNFFLWTSRLVDTPAPHVCFRHASPHPCVDVVLNGSLV